MLEFSLFEQVTLILDILGAWSITLCYRPPNRLATFAADKIFHSKQTSENMRMAAN